MNPNDMTACDAETCSQCRAEITPADLALGWPVAVDDGAVCPSCYGDDAYCPEGHVLPAHEGSSCAECPDPAELCEYCGEVDPGEHCTDGRFSAGDCEPGRGN